MNEPLHNYMRVGLVHFMAFPECMGGEGPILETLTPLLRDPFFEAIEITHIKDADQAEAVGNAFAQAGVEPVFGAQPILLGGGLDLNHEAQEQRGQAIAKLKRAFNRAAEIGCKRAAVLSGPVSDKRTVAKRLLTESLTELAAYAQAKGMSLVLETFDQVPYGKNCLIGPTTDAVEVARNVRQQQPSFGLLLDLSHLPLLHETPRHALELAQEYLTHVHIGNCAMDDPSHPAYGDNHPRIGAPGTRVGVEELAVFLRVLLKMDYLTPDTRPIVSFEVKPMPGESPELVIAQSKRALEEAWRLV